VSNNKDIILFIDEIHNLVGAGAAEGAIDASNMLKPQLARGELHCVGATTLNEYRKVFIHLWYFTNKFSTLKKILLWQEGFSLFW
jgi:ATP-dependent Clp protease ATP-binding subunit ClpA